ncbi:hypothetical protein LJ207_08310 [Halanaerobium sp. Z-7514]|uniref:Uncharacterized protein n=1 Tax=Halanaerobium polyolivorans TaxID=2886943 RepID=A0AAW4X0I2_9FIRM|nr:hypothetical protein [Halanaerobium polyolivorans]MCC3145324.1 hypothetical protein [Halanaerobium polyolivorans]
MKKLYISLIAIFALIIGIFTPLVSAPMIGQISYFSDAQGGALFIFMLALISLILTINKYFKHLAITALSALAFNIYTFIQLKESAGENVELLVYEYGWIFLILGSLLLLIAALKK